MQGARLAESLPALRITSPKVTGNQAPNKQEEPVVYEVAHKKLWGPFEVTARNLLVHLSWTFSYSHNSTTVFPVLSGICENDRNFPSHFPGTGAAVKVLVAGVSLSQRTREELLP